MTKKLLRSLLKKFGQPFSEELGINLKSKKSSEIFKWFLASLLFGARISETIAKNTYKVMVGKYKLNSPQKIIKAGWDFLVSRIMREGGYVRYDGKTSDELLSISRKLIKEYKSDINQIHKQAKNEKDLENKLQQFKSVGPITCNIFLRELRGIWTKANPDFSPLVKLAAKKLRINNIRKFWQKNRIKGYNLVSFEAALLRLGKDYFRKGKTRKDVLKILEK